MPFSKEADRNSQKLLHFGEMVKIFGWLVVLGLTALWDSNSVYIGPSPRKREKEKRSDTWEKKCPNNPHPHLPKRNRPLPYYNPVSRTPRHWKFAQHLHTTRPPPKWSRNMEEYSYIVSWHVNVQTSMCINTVCKTHTCTGWSVASRMPTWRFICQAQNCHAQTSLTPLPSERPKLHTILAFLSAIGLRIHANKN